MADGSGVGVMDTVGVISGVGDPAGRVAVAAQVFVGSASSVGEATGGGVKSMFAPSKERRLAGHSTIDGQKDERQQAKPSARMKATCIVRRISWRPTP